MVTAQGIAFLSQLRTLISCKNTLRPLMVHPLIADVAFCCGVLNHVFQLHSDALGFLAVFI